MLKNIFLLMIIIIIIIQYNNNIDIIVSKQDIILENKEKFNSTSYELIDYNDNNNNNNNNDLNTYKVTEYDKPNPWTKVVFDKLQEYNYSFYIKIKIPSLNDYQQWKEIIPNLDFIPKTGELIIPSKDEPSALALANLIISNFMGYLTINDIIKKNLIQISISKCKSHEIVQNKIRLQIIDMLYPTNNNNQEITLQSNQEITLESNQENTSKSNQEIISKSNKKIKNKNKKNNITNEDNIMPYNNITNEDNIVNDDNIGAYVYSDSSYSYL